MPTSIPPVDARRRSVLSSWYCQRSPDDGFHDTVFDGLADEPWVPQATIATPASAITTSLARDAITRKVTASSAYLLSPNTNHAT